MKRDLRYFFTLLVIICTAIIYRQVNAETNHDGDHYTDIVFYRPGGPWNTVPVLLANGNGGWKNTNKKAPTWAQQPGVVAIGGDFNGDGHTDVAFHKPSADSTWATVPVLFSNGDGTWKATNKGVPTWAHQNGTVAIAGDFNGDGRTDLTFHKPIAGSTWTTAPVLFSNGDGTWKATNKSVPTWAHQKGAVAIVGDFNGDARTDVAFHKPITGSTWATTPVLFSNGDGTWKATNKGVPTWAHQKGVVAIAGDFNGDGRTDITFHKPIAGSRWETAPVLFSNGNGTWKATNKGVPTWAHQKGTVAIAGDYNGDGRSDVAFHKPIAGSTWVTVPVAFSNGNGTWKTTNQKTPTWPHQLGATAISGDFNSDGRTDIAFHRPSGPWNTVPVLFAKGDGMWKATNKSAPAWAHQPGVVAVKHTNECILPTQLHLDVRLRPQETGMWCWAASGQMTMEYLGRNVSQCTQANNRFGRNDCCNTPTPGNCVVGGWPEYGKYNFTSKHTNNAALSWNQLRRELACSRRVIAFSWGWPGGGGHMMAAIGYRIVNGVNFVEVNDPWAPNVGDHRFETYDFYVESSGHHIHWDDYYEIKNMEVN